MREHISREAAWAALRRYNQGTTSSLPVRGAWIEISGMVARFRGITCRSPCGERGLKSFTIRNPRKH